MKKDLAIRALDMAIRLRNPPPGCLFHLDRGSQYCSYAYQKKLQAYGLRPSMSGKGNCYDNASVETFFKSLKAELIWRQKWPTRRHQLLARHSKNSSRLLPIRPARLLIGSRKLCGRLVEPQPTLLNQ